MANLAELQVRIGANTAGLSAGIANAKKALSGLKRGAKGFSLSDPFNNAMKPIKGSTQAVVNFNRVLQDAPYGIIGVANNLEPMIQSFNTLKEETGSTTGALKTLTKSALTGPGALITAVSLASTVAVIFAQRMRGAGSSSKEASEKIKATTEAVDELSSKFNSLAGLSLTQETEREIDVIDRAIRVAEGRAEAQETINRLTSKANKRTAELTDAEGKQLIQARKIRDNADAVINQLGFEATSVEELTKVREKATARLEVYNNSLTEQERVAKRVDDIQADVAQSIDAYTAGSEGAQQSLIQLALAYKKRIEDLQSEGTLTQTQIVLVNQLKESYDDLVGALDKASKVDVSNTFTKSGAVNVQVVTDMSDEQVQDEAKKVKPPKLPVMVEPKLDPLSGSIADLQAQVKGFENGLQMAQNPQVTQELMAKIEELREKIRLLGGDVEETSQSTKNLANFANIVGGAFAQAVIQGKRLDNALKGIIAQLASKAFVLGLGSLLTGGGSLGGKSFLTNLFGGAFASGGRPPVGKASLVGERGPELFVPSTHGTIIPNNALSGGNGNGITKDDLMSAMNSLNWVIRGEDIYVTSNRGGSRYDR